MNEEEKITQQQTAVERTPSLSFSDEEKEKQRQEEEKILNEAKEGKDFAEALSAIPPVRNGLPYAYLIGRDLIGDIVKITNEILSNRRDLKKLQEEGKPIEADPNKGEYEVTSKGTTIVKQVGKLEIYAEILSFAKKLYNDSALVENKNHTGLLLRDPNKKIENIIDFYQNAPVIMPTLNELTEFLGDTGSQGRKAMNAAISLMSNATLNSVEWRFAYLLETNRNSKKRKQNEAIYYVILLNPIFASISSNFGYLAQDAGKMLNAVTKRSKTAEDILLLALLCAQGKTKPFRREISTLVEELDIKEEYERSRGRTEEKLYKLFQHRKEEGMLSSFSFIGKDSKGEDITLHAPFEKGMRPLKIVATFNPDYGREPKEQEEAQAEAEPQQEIEEVGS